MVQPERCVVLRAYPVLVLFLSSLLLPACAAEPVIRLATLEYPPYVTDTGKGAQGLTVDLVAAAFARIGRPIRIEVYPVARGQQKLLSGEVDGFFSIKKTPERERELLFTQKALIAQDYVFFVRKDARRRFNGDFGSVADLDIGVVAATSYGKRFDGAVRAGELKKLDIATSHETNFRKLLARRVDAVICSRLVGLYYLGRLDGLKDVEISGPVVETTYSYLAFTRKKDHTALASRFDQALLEIEAEGSAGRRSEGSR